MGRAAGRSRLSPGTAGTLLPGLCSLSAIARGWPGLAGGRALLGRGGARATAGTRPARGPSRRCGGAGGDAPLSGGPAGRGVGEAPRAGARGRCDPRGAVADGVCRGAGALGGEPTLHPQSHRLRSAARPSRHPGGGGRLHLDAFAGAGPREAGDGRRPRACRRRATDKRPRAQPFQRCQGPAAAAGRCRGSATLDAGGVHEHAGLRRGAGLDGGTPHAARSPQPWCHADTARLAGRAGHRGRGGWALPHLGRRRWAISAGSHGPDDRGLWRARPAARCRRGGLGA